MTSSQQDAAGPAPKRWERAPAIADLTVGDLLPQRVHEPTSVSLFLYNAAVWNPHRIHYDEAYAIEVEGHNGVVVDGPLQGDWISQVVVNWLDTGDELMRFSYSNRGVAYLGEQLTSGGKVAAIDVAASLVHLDLWVMNQANAVITPGSATVFLAG